jgi:hypothetical protein
VHSVLEVFYVIDLSVSGDAFEESPNRKRDCWLSPVMKPSLIDQRPIFWILVGSWQKFMHLHPRLCVLAIFSNKKLSTLSESYSGETLIYEEKAYKYMQGSSF